MNESSTNTDISCMVLLKLIKNRWYLLGINLGLNEFEYNLILTRSFNYHGHPPLPRISTYLLHLSLHMQGEMHAYKVVGTKLVTC